MQTDAMTTERIDVLAVLNTAERSIIGAGSSEFRPAMREAIAVVAELIEVLGGFVRDAEGNGYAADEYPLIARGRAALARAGNA